jgi:hypothetical protein
MKSTQKIIQARVEEIMQLRLLGALPTDIRRHAEEQKWEVSERQLQRYAASADELLAAAVEKNRDRLMAHHFAARRALFARAMAVSDYRTALAVLKDEGELLALYPAKKTELTGKDGTPMVLKITEEIVGQQGAPLSNIVEEVVTSEHSGNGNGSAGTAGKEDPLASRGASLPPE